MQTPHSKNKQTYRIETYDVPNSSIKGKKIIEIATGHELAFEDDPKGFPVLEKYYKVLKGGTVGFAGWTPEFILNAFGHNNKGFTKTELIV